MTEKTPHCLAQNTQTRLLEHLSRVYGKDLAPQIFEGLAALVAQHCADHTPRYGLPHWNEQDTILISYGDTIQAPAERPLATLNRFANENLQDAFRSIHLLPIFPYSSDYGFAVISYRDVNRELGDWEDIAKINEHFDLAIDFVLNHCSTRNLWFTDFLEDREPGREFFIEVDPKENLTMVVRPRTTPLLAEFYTRQGKKYVWATFSHDQIDLNYANPTVLLEFIDIMLFYIRHGARILRLDAVAYLWKKIGTPCIHLPETHEIIKLFHDLLAEIEPGVILLTETNVPHEENISYFGHGDEAHCVYQFSLPPLLLHAIHSGNTRYLFDWASNLEPPPQGCTYFNFTASHDGIGLRPLEGIVPTDELHAMLDEMRNLGGFVSMKKNADGSESPYELNLTYFDACRDAQDRWHKERFLLTQTVAMSLQGLIAVYIHSLLATPNDFHGVEVTGMTRAINRRRWDLTELGQHLTDVKGLAQYIFDEYLRRLKIRRTHKAFHPDGPQKALDLGPELFGFCRTAPDYSERIIALYNFTPFSKSIRLPEHPELNDDFIDLLTDKPPIVDTAHAELVIPPYGCYWLSASTASIN